MGGDTLRQYDCGYESLSPGMQQYLEGLFAVHDFAQGFKESLAEPGGRERLGEALANNPPVRHPVVQVHPETGRKALFVNALFTSHIEGLPPLESSALLAFLCQHAVLPEHTCRFRWPRTVWCSGTTEAPSTSRLMISCRLPVACTGW